MSTRIAVLVTARHTVGRQPGFNEYLCMKKNASHLKSTLYLQCICWHVVEIVAHCYSWLEITHAGISTSALLTPEMFLSAHGLVPGEPIG